jgi:hypothetical protein
MVLYGFPSDNESHYICNSKPKGPSGNGSTSSICVSLRTLRAEPL